MSEVKVNKITPTADCGTVTLGDSGDTVAIPAGVTLTSGGALQNSGTITNTGTITGVAITGTIDNQVNWQTTVKTTGFTATAGEGYFCDTTSAAFTVTLPASPSAGDLVGIKDYANTADTNNITIGRNGSNIEGVANDFVIEVEGGSITLIYVDATKGWLSTAAAKASDISEQALFVTATGGTVTCCGDYKIHTFTGPGTFCVSCAGNTAGNNKVDYLVVAGGGGGGSARTGCSSGAGGGGAGGFRESYTPAVSGPYTASPLKAACGALTVTVQGYPIAVGGGGGTPSCGPNAPGQGNNSIFSTITSSGGGAGANNTPADGGAPGGSGGGGSNSYNDSNITGGTGNTPPVSPPQGKDGGNGIYAGGAAGGGGATSCSGTGGTPTGNGSGGAGATTSISGSPVAYGGGGGAGDNTAASGFGTGGSGGGGDGGDRCGSNLPVRQGKAGTANTGGGGGAGASGPQRDQTGGAGGSGIVIIRYKFQ